MTRTLGKITSPIAINYFYNVYVYVLGDFLVHYTLNDNLSYCYFIVELLFNLHTISTQVLLILDEYLLVTIFAIKLK